MTVFDPVEAQQHIKGAREQVSAMFDRPGSMGIGVGSIADYTLKICSALESAVEYIAELETKHHSGFNCSNRYEAVNRRMVTAEAEVARLNSQIARDKRANDSVDSWIELANRYESKLNAVHAYINENEHPDDWGVPCVYTKDLRAILTTVSTEPESENK